MIVKIQCDMTGQNVLVYNKPRTVFEQIMATEEPEIAELVIQSYDLKPLTKVYVRADLNDDGTLMFGDRVKDKNW